ncbi:hypothetical protein VA596_23840 [Amycolatopsis sp., V23-08]|uniref:Uncharacterized protein n=1 Tax=Amycolatopsis heterodermiae TaxID=3110235 RepID=A0ABU5RAC0_9PSEU|nr:hypothetical protein [Amycolatopsis sp., V23-08]MEA5362589.1 hypothetical protein [Amycolatopsis sp., V23-08]
MFGDGAGQDLVEDPPAPVAVLLAVVADQVQDLDLVVATPQREARPVAQSGDLRPSLGRDLGPELRQVAGVFGAGEHEVLPDEHARFVAGGVEVVVLVDPAAPDAQHREVAVPGLADALAQEVAVAGADERARRHPVGAAHEKREVVEQEAEEAARLDGVRAAVKGDGAQADPVLDDVEEDAVGGQLDPDVVQRRLAEVVGPPQHRIVQLDLGGAGVVGRQVRDADAVPGEDRAVLGAQPHRTPDPSGRQPGRELPAPGEARLPQPAGDDCGEPHRMPRRAGVCARTGTAAGQPDAGCKLFMSRPRANSKRSCPVPATGSATWRRACGNSRPAVR